MTEAHPSIRATVWDLSDHAFDLLVIGAGATGAGIAREAALRGLSVALVDRNDIGGGTSSRSSRLIHGGLRYLEHRRVSLVRESLSERGVLLRLAPHLVRPLAFIFPTFRGDRVGRWKLELGLIAYDLLAARGNVPRHRALSKRAVLRREPRVRERGLTGGSLYWDAQCDDARLTLAAARAAAALGARVANHACVTALDIRNGRAAGAVIEDQLTGAVATVSARVVVNAAGPWCDAIRRLEDPGAAPLLAPTRGAHVMVPRARLGHTHAVTFLSPIDGRVMFVLPWGDQSYVGTTDTDDPGSPDHVLATDADVTYLLRSANALFPSARLSAEDVSLTWAALRPLARPAFDEPRQAGSANPGGSASARSREHVIASGPRGMVTIAGGKLTTFRLMAADLVDRVEQELGRQPSGGTARSSETPFPGGRAFDRSAVLDRATRLHLPEAVGRRLIDRYGDESPRLLDLVAADRALACALHPRHAAIAAEVVHAVRAELARRLDDVLVRRLGLAYEVPGAAVGLAAETATLMARELGWDDERVRIEVERYRDLVHAGAGSRSLS